MIRHGQTPWNKEGRIQGQVNVPLNDEGKAQALVARKEIEGIKFDAVFCSPLERTRQTCELAHGLDGVVFDDRILERDFGDNDGIKRLEVDFDAFWTEGTPENAACGESLSDMTARVVNFLDELHAKYKGKNVLVVTHGGVIMIMCAYFYGTPKDGNFLNYLVTNGAVTKFQFK